MKPVQSNTSKSESESKWDFIGRYVKTYYDMWRKDKDACTQPHTHALIIIRKKSMNHSMCSEKKKKHWLYKQIFFWVTFIFKIMWYVQFIKLQLNYLMAKYYIFLAILNWGSENTYYAVNVAILTVLRPKIVSWTFFSFVYNII